jgi:hypothetical protein
LKIRVKFASEDEWIELEGAEAECFLCGPKYTEEELIRLRKIWAEAIEIYRRHPIEFRS